MGWMIWAGAAVALAGVAGLLWCVVDTLRARRQELSDSELRGRLQRAVAMNLGALFVSAIGLMMVVIGILLA